ncbi:hypothetical protein BUALT_BualtUnG0034900 [Buddleja alternifolia]|uniref:Uncharacterized protein n=1 Tax=Buddleja alternifolia TaxID=168488 RepID=A0AAV6W508_9LAMI|nr:hypothetical protein BUALT_BualtUnG0034900 [Buddleja alternifolia]
MQFLMGLNEAYKPVRGQILLMRPLPSIEDAYCMVQQEERQMDMTTFVSMDDNSAAMYASNNTNHGNQPKSWNQNGQGNNNNGQNPVWNSVNKRNLWCEHCHTTGHTQAKCFRLHDFPLNYKPKGKKTYNGGGFQGNQGHNANYSASYPNAVTNTTSMGPSGNHASYNSASQTQINSANASTSTPQLTPDQIQQLLTLLGKQTIQSQCADSTPHLAVALALKADKNATKSLKFKPSTILSSLCK